jgi:hypothetical protein
MAARPRLHYLDNLRAFVIILVIVLERAHRILDVPIPAVAKFAILVAVTLAGSLAVSALVLKRVPGLRRMF